jgi:hypothetical protein
MYSADVSSPEEQSSPPATTRVQVISDVAALDSLLVSAAASRQLILLKGGEGWCPFSRLADSVVGRLHDIISEHSDELDDAEGLSTQLCVATVDVGRPGASQLRERLRLPATLPIPWFVAFFGDRQIPLDGMRTGGLWNCQDGALVGADICKQPGSLALLCEHLLDEVA